MARERLGNSRADTRLRRTSRSVPQEAAMFGPPVTQSIAVIALKFLAGCTAAAVVAAATVVTLGAATPQPAEASDTTKEAAGAIVAAVEAELGSDDAMLRDDLRIIRIDGIGELHVALSAGLTIERTLLAAGLDVSVSRTGESLIAAVVGAATPLQIRIASRGGIVDACFLVRTQVERTVAISSTGLVEIDAVADVATGDGGLDTSVDASVGTEDTAAAVPDIPDVVIEADVDALDLISVDGDVAVDLGLGSKLRRLTNSLGVVDVGVDVDASTPTALLDADLAAAGVPNPNAVAPITPTTEIAIVWTCETSHEDHTITVIGNDEDADGHNDTSESVTAGSEPADAPESQVAGASTGSAGDGNGTGTPPAEPEIVVDPEGDVPATDSPAPTGDDAPDASVAGDDDTDADEDGDQDDDDNHDHHHGDCGCGSLIEIDLFAGIG